MDLILKSVIFCSALLCILQSAPSCADEVKFSDLQFSTIKDYRRGISILRRRSAGNAAGDTDFDRAVIASLPKPSMHRWFPKHDMPPTDSPEVPPENVQEPPDLEKGPEWKNNSESGRKSYRVEAIFQDQLSVEIEDSFQEEIEETEDPMQPSRKPIRERRDLRSIMEVRRRHAEIMRRRKEIAARERRMRTTTRSPRINRPAFRPTRPTNKKPVAKKKPTTNRPITHRPTKPVVGTTRPTISIRKPYRAQNTTPNRKTKPIPTTRQMKSPVKQATSEKIHTTSGAVIATTDGDNIATVATPSSSSSHAYDKNQTSHQSTISVTSKRSNFQPTSASRENYHNRIGSGNHRQRNGFSRPLQRTNRPSASLNQKRGSKNTQKRFTRLKTVMVVKPVLSSDGIRTTTTVKRLLVRMSDVAQGRNAKARVTFSKWGTWAACNVKGCGRAGKQMRTRTCFGDKLTAADYTVCNYDSLVQERQCRTPGCTTTAEPTSTIPTPIKRTSRWSAWSQCSVTCGTGGRQTRTKLCYESSRDDSDDMVPINCRGETLENRPCQYSVSCPMWDEWSEWSSCSKTCGKDGVSFRDRKCVVKRYLSFGQKGGNKQRIQFDNAAASDPTVPEPAKRNKKNSLGHLSGSATKAKQSSRFPQGFGYLKKDGQEIFIVDAPRPKQYAQPPFRRSSEFYEDQAVKELIGFELCSALGGYSEEERRCVQARCPAVWGTWTDWSSCSVTCGLGISRRERSCSSDNFSGSCVGRKYAYRRCYAPPCWGEWTRWSRCSVSCGFIPGRKKRSRECHGVTTVIPEYTHCEGKDSESEECTTEKPCPGDTWGSWGPYEACSASCNGGYRQRKRKCLSSKCSGSSEDFGRCNIHECPTWSKWTAYSCCSVTCGQGTRKRTRKCIHGDIGNEGCIGKVADFEVCYQAPCSGSQKSIFSSFRCGIGSVSKLKTIAKLRIVGGAKSAAHEWPWQTSLQHRDSKDSEWQHFCGATLLHPRWVITASHCTEESDFVVNHRNPGADWSVVVGMVKLYRDGKRYFVDRIYIHPKYEYKSVTKNDIALLKLRKMVPVTEDVMPVCLPRGMRPMAGESCYVTGWGYTTSDPNASLSLSLREAEIPIMRFQKCRALGDHYRYFLDSTIHMCAGDPITASADSCTGDSGGPLVCSRNRRWHLSAVTSFGFADCGTPGHVGVYAPMDTYEQWVRKTIEAHTYERC